MMQVYNRAFAILSRYYTALHGALLTDVAQLHHIVNYQISLQRVLQLANMLLDGLC